MLHSRSEGTEAYAGQNKALSESDFWISDHLLLFVGALLIAVFLLAPHRTMIAGLASKATRNALASATNAKQGAALKDAEAMRKSTSTCSPVDHPVLRRDVHRLWPCRRDERPLPKVAGLGSGCAHEAEDDAQVAEAAPCEATGLARQHKIWWSCRITYCRPTKILSAWCSLARTCHWTA